MKEPLVGKIGHRAKSPSPCTPTAAMTTTVRRRLLTQVVKNPSVCGLSYYV